MSDSPPLKVISSFGPEGYELYGRKFLESYIKHWETPITVYVEDRGPYPSHERIEYKSLWEIPQLTDILQRAQQKENHLDWKYNVFKFARKALAECEAAKEHEGYLFWIDADTAYTKAVDRAFLERCILGASMCFMGRVGFHPCTSFVGWDTRRDDTGRFFEVYRHLYVSGDVYAQCPEYHDAFVTDWVRRQEQVRARDLCADMEVSGPDNVFEMVVPGGIHKKGMKKYE